MDNLDFKNHCMRCKEKKKIKNPQKYTMKGGRESIKGECPDCGCPIYKPLNREEKEKLSSSVN